MISAKDAFYRSNDNGLQAVIEACNEAVIRSSRDKEFSTKVLIDTDTASPSIISEAKKILEDVYGYKVNFNSQFVSKEVDYSPEPDVNGFVPDILLHRKINFEVIELDWSENVIPDSRIYRMW